MKRLVAAPRALVWIAGAAVAAFAVWMLILFVGGARQQINATVVQQRLVRGMSISDAEYALGLPPGTLRPEDDGMVQVTRSGIMSYLVPQHNIYLIFTDGRLTGAYVEVVYQLDELSQDIPLRDAVPEDMAGEHEAQRSGHAPGVSALQPHYRGGRRNEATLPVRAVDPTRSASAKLERGPREKSGHDD